MRYWGPVSKRMGTNLVPQGGSKVFEDVFHHSDNLETGGTEIDNSAALVSVG